MGPRKPLHGHEKARGGAICEKLFKSANGPHLGRIEHQLMKFV